ncbi:MAG TPA: DUF3108 domain-containing protein [Burkholderiales bacterium]
MRLAFVLFWCLCLNAAADEMPQSVTIVYDVMMESFSLGTGTEVLETNGRSYSIVSQTHPTGIAALIPKAKMRRESRGMITSQGLRPQQFLEQLGKDEPAIAKFDWEKKLITFERGGNAQSEALPNIAYDRLCIAYNFVFHQPQGEDFQFYMTDGKRLSDYRYLMVGKEILNTPMGKIQTVHWTKQREKETDRGADLWLATEQYYLPVRIVFTDKGGRRYDQVAKQISYQ